MQFTVDCPWCKGLNPECAECQGYGKIEFHRCKHTHYGQAHLDIVRSVSFLESGVLPVAGGWTDQSATWVDAVGVVRCEIEDYRKKAREA